MKHLNKDLIDCGIESLVSIKSEYAEYSRKDHAIAKALEAPLSVAENKDFGYRPYRAVVQAMFESGFLDTGESCFNTEQLFKYIMGVKVYHKVDMFLTLHANLMELGATDHDGKGFNTSGDNYFSAYEFDKVLSESSKTVMKLYPRERVTPPKTKVIIIENQSPMFAVVMDYCAFTQFPKRMTLVRLKRNYDDTCRIQQFLDIVKTSKIEEDHKWSAYNDSIDYGVITTLDLDKMECNPVLNYRDIESVLFSIGSGYDVTNAHNSMKKNID